MTIWVDAHLSPEIATWIAVTFGITALALRDIGLRDAEDSEIFEVAKAQGIIFMTKDSDFVDLVDRFGAPPQIIWLTCGNTSNARVERDFECNIAKSTRAFASRRSVSRNQRRLAAQAHKSVQRTL